MTTSRLLLCTLALTGCGREPSSQPRNVAERVILITCDTLRADRTGVYGCERGTTPELDRFAEECVVFERAFAAAPLTLSALASLMTGRLPEELGVVSNKVQLPAEATTVAELPSAAGIPTAAIVSNWVLRRRTREGLVGIEQGFASYDDRMEAVDVNRPGMRERLASSATDEAIRWIQENKGHRPDDRTERRGSRRARRARIRRR